MDRSEIQRVIRNFAIEVLIYAVLVIVYFFLILQLLAEPLHDLFDNNLVVYAFVALLLIVAQGVVLEFVTSFIMDLLGLDKLE